MHKENPIADGDPVIAEKAEGGTLSPMWSVVTYRMLDTFLTGKHASNL